LPAHPNNSNNGVRLVEEDKRPVNGFHSLQHDPEKWIPAFRKDRA
jgi:hypothetical protein